MVIWALLWAIAGVWGERPQLKASDAVFMYAPYDPTLYDAYAGTVVGWAGRARSKNAQDVQWFRQRVEEAREKGLRYCGSVDFVVDFGGFIAFCPDRFMEAVCRDLDDNPITVPWLWDHRYKGHPAYWFCTNNPDYRAYLSDQVERTCVAPIDGLHIDDWRGTAACSAWFGGCFCRHCMEGFRDWLKQRFTKEQLGSMGIERVEEFDLKAFLKSKGITAEQWRRQRSRLPFGELFQQFQTEQMLQVVREVFEYAESLKGKPLLRSVNSSGSSPEALVVAPLVDFFCGEMDHHALTAQVPVEPAFVFKLAEGLGKRQAATASGQDWAWIAANEKPGLVRTWIAQAYAFGNAFMVPHHQWCYTPEKGTHWWEGKTEDFAFVYRFIRENANLFDGYRELANLSLAYTHENFSEIRSVALELLKANIPFNILAMEPTLGVKVTKKDLSACEFLLTGKHPLSLDFERLVKSSKVSIVQWQGIDKLPEKVLRQVKLNSGKVRVSLRYKPDDPTAPVICHLLNQDYDLQRDDVRPARVAVSINRLLLSKAIKDTPKRAILRTPMLASEEIPIQLDGDWLTFTVPELGFWALIEIPTR